MTLDIGDEPGYGKLFIGGLSWETTVEKLSEYFCRFGEVTDCVVMKNAETGRSRGFGFVTFKDPSCVQIVTASGPHSLDGRTIDPKECNPKSAQKGKREAKVGNFPKVFLGGLPANVNESVLREFFSKYGKVVEVVIMYDQEKKKTRGFGFLSFDNEETIDKVVAEHFVNIHGKQVEIKRAEPRDKATGKPLSGHMINSSMQAPGGGHPISTGMPPWNPMWGPQPGPPMHVPPPPGQPPPPQTGAPIPTMPNGIMPSGYPPAWNSSQQAGAYAAGNGWTQPPSYQNYQQWTGYGYPPQGWAQGYSYGPYNTSYPAYGQTTGQTSVNAGQTQVAQTPMTANVAANTGAAVGAYMQGAGVASNIAAGAQAVIPTVGTSVPQSAATMGSYPQDASSYGPARVASYTNAPNYANYALQGQGDASNVAASAYAGANPSNTSSAPYSRASSQAQGYHPYRRV